MGSLIGEDFWLRWFPTGVIEAALPHIAEIGFDWSKPLSEWSREEMTRFLREALHVIQNEMIRRDKISPFDDEIPWV
jgi:hypothetical protein